MRQNTSYEFLHRFKVPTLAWVAVAQSGSERLSTSLSLGSRGQGRLIKGRQFAKMTCYGRW